DTAVTRLVATVPGFRPQRDVAAARSAAVEAPCSRSQALAGPVLPEVPAARLAVLTPKALIDAADARTRDRILLGLLACLALVGGVAYLQGRSIVRNLRRFATAAREIAHGSLGERVPIRGHDEFAAL